MEADTGGGAATAHDAAAKPVRLFRSLTAEQATAAALFFIALVYPGVQSVPLALFTFLALYIAMFHGDFWYRSWLTLNRDLTGLYLVIALKQDQKRRMKENKGLPALFLDLCRKYADKPAVIEVESDQRWTFAELNAEANRYANLFQAAGYRKGDVVALFLENGFDFIAAWLGLAKLGVITAWVNCNLRAEPLSHCVRTSAAKAAITSENLSAALVAALKDGDLKLEDGVFVLKSDSEDCGSTKNLAHRLAESKTTEPRELDSVDFQSVLCFIYTSGTTGLPKAAVIKHFRYYAIAVGPAMTFGLRASDRLYVSMPIYHTAAGILGVGQCLLRGSTVVIRKKFSASNFWRDCARYECTASQYIGEICRYLLAQPECPEEKEHGVRIMIGNGLRAQIWQRFVDRFSVRVGEVYGSTEGNASLVNIDGRVGACGFLPISPLTKKMHPVRLVRVDPTTGTILRKANGLCHACEPGETGAMVTVIRKDSPLLAFEGYLNKSETSKKVIRDVFRRGDSCFVTGDILHWDRLGYVYFKDRTGDTYRWKGENVSTTEVEAILQPVPDIVDSTVYGVQVPGREGRAGMVAVVQREEGADRATDDFVQSVGAKLAASLPAYAVPVFLRLCRSVDKTGTFKLIKTNLQKAGFDPVSVEDLDHDDQIYVWSTGIRNYEPLTRPAYEQILEGRHPNV